MARLVSIIINNYNYGRFLRQAIESAFAQTYENVEVIIVDDGSVDNSRDILSEYADRAIVICKTNGGQASAFNAGITQAKGDFALLLDSDDYLFPDAVQKCVEAFPTGYARIYFRLRAVDECCQPIPEGASSYSFELMDGEVFKDVCVDKQNIFLGPPTSGNCFDTRILKMAMPIPEDEYRICADAFVLVRTSMLGPIKGLDQELAAYRLHRDNAFYAYSSLFSNSKRLHAQIDNHYTCTKLLSEAAKETGSAWRPMLAHKNFWLIHLLSAGLVWSVGNLKTRGVSRSDVLLMVGWHLRAGTGGWVKRSAQSLYLLALLLLPRFLAQKMLFWIDSRKFRIGRSGGSR